MEREDADVETSSEDYARRFAGPVGAWFLAVQARTTLELLRPWPRASVLDVGGGHAQITAPLLDAGHEVTVLGSVEVCAARLRPWLERAQVRFRAADLLRTPWPDRAFDVVVSYRLLAHARRWRDLVGELARLARHAVLLDYPTRRSLNAVAEALFGLKRGVEGNTRPFAVFRDAEVRDELSRRGFRPTARRPQFLFPMALHRALGSAATARFLEGGASALRLTPSFGSPVILRAERDG